jgi:hypothetical protein
MRRRNGSERARAALEDARTASPHGDRGINPGDPMRTAPIAMLALILLAACAPKTPKAYDYTDWGFGATFPHEPKLTDIPAAADRPHEFRAEMTEDGHDFTVDVTDGAGTNQTDAQVLAAAPQAITDSFGGAMSNETDVAVGAVPGKEIHVDRDGQQTLVIRLYAVNHKLYQVAAQSEKGPGDPAAKAFLDSFRLLSK